MNDLNRITLEPLARPERFSAGPDLRPLFEQGLERALDRVEANLATFSPGLYPAPASVGLVYPAVPNVEWTSSFWTGMLWLAFEATGRSVFRDAALAQLPDFRARLDQRRATDTHDLGFLYTLAAVNAWKLAGDERARQMALKAADLLMVRYYEKAGVLQAWGNLNDPSLRGRIIIDCAMNLPLLFWASEQTGNGYYREGALQHLAQANRHLIRDNASSFHTYYFDVDSGKPLRGTTAQGYADDSCWSRGQAWGILGMPLNYRYTGDPSLLEVSRRLAHYFLNRLPEDQVCYWDLVFTSGPEERDTSGAAIAACGLLELARGLPVTDPLRSSYEGAALGTLASLVQKYTTVDQPHSNGLLTQAVYNKPKNEGVNECNIWGDYFYLEALVRTTRPWTPVW